MSKLAHEDTLEADPAFISATLSAGSRIPSTGDGGEPAPSASLRGKAIGRYVILGMLGAGGMGAVYTAYDPELERKIALKLVRPDASRGDGVRLLREARALAKLSHPNVVAVHDVGTIGGGEESESAQVFIAMEFIEGATLSKWLQARPRSTREILDVFIAAARGLCAAHAAGLIHRDFKPDNTMIGDDGRVRVMDFGLARAAQAPAPNKLPDDTLVSGKMRASDIRLTHQGALLGTPPYMAPEQWRGGEVDARTDQFAFCVALWEALFGVRPFTGRTVHALMVTITSGTITPPPPGRRRIPAYLRRVLERGLSVKPEQRFPTMEALLAELSRGRSRRIRLSVLLGVGAVCVVVAALMGARSRRLAACDAEGASIAEVWNDAVKQELRAALVATGVSYAETSYEKAASRIDEWAAEWSDLRVQTCREVRVEFTRTPALYERAAACFDEQRDALASLLEVLRASTTTDVQNVVPAVAGLARLIACTEQSSLERRPRPPEDPAVREQVSALRHELRKVEGLFSAGRYKEGLAAAETLLAAAEELGYRPLYLEALAMVGKIGAQRDASDRAEEALRRVYVEAGEIGADELAAEVAIHLVSTVGAWKNRPGEGLQWGFSAEMLIRRLGLGQELLGASLANNLAQVYRAKGAYQDALKYNEQALAIRERILGPSHPDVAVTLNVLATLQRATFDYEAAQASHERALQIRTAALGPDHPDVATTLNNLGLLHRVRGNYAESQALLERALALREQAVGEEHPDVATTRGNLGVALQSRGDYAGAQALLERALAIHEKRGPENTSLAIVANDLGVLYLARGRHKEARELLERSLTIRKSKLEPGHPQLAGSLEGLALLSFTIGDHQRALDDYESVLAMRRARADTPPPDIARVLLGLAQVREVRGEREEALKLAREAQALFESTLGPEHPDAAPYFNALAQLQRRSDPGAARALAERARTLTARTRGATHPLLATSLRILGELDLDAGELAAARTNLTGALKTLEGSVGPDAFEVADTLLDLAELARRAGPAEDAAPLLERALAIRERGGAAEALINAVRAELERARARPQETP